VKLGFSSMNTPEELGPDQLARALEARGYDSLWIGEHSHIPTSRKTPYPSGGDLPESYKRMMDPFVSLTMAAAATTGLLIGTSVALALEHDVFQLAKTIATLDCLSGGRVQVGVGAGWNEEELANHRPDVPWSRRYGALAECVAALRALWTEEEASFHGRFYDFDPVWAYPKPRQRPHPPILCGMAGRVGTAQTLAWADEWMPMDIALGNVDRRVASFRKAVAEAGRDPDGFPITIVAFGDPAPETLAHYRDLGIRRTVLGAARTGWDDPETTLPFIDRYAPLVESLA
jgi:probable F420-dependent oxidoreductase